MSSKAADRQRRSALAESNAVATGELIIVANRLPVRRGESGRWEPSPGGVATAIKAACAERQTTWIGWTGEVGEAEQPCSDHGLSLAPVELDESELEGFYRGFSNSTLWPLYHDAIAQPVLDEDYWTTYRRVNHRFARSVAAAASEGATVWVHDYHLQLVPLLLRTARPDLRIGFFLHIPFPSPDLFLRLPWRVPLIAGLLGADLLGFQTDNDAANFRAAAGRLGGRIARRADSTPCATFPVGIDSMAIRKLAEDESVHRRSAELRSAMGEPSTVLLGVDRLDYTKGIPARLRAYRELLAAGRLDASSTTMIQIAEPTRDHTPGYAEVRAEVEHLVGQINGEYGSFGTPAVVYVHRGQSIHELVALYRTADVMLVTPFRDGMNLVAKEYVAAHQSLPGGALVLSEFAGASSQLTDARLVNPFDVESLKSAITLAATEGSPPGAMAAMADEVERHDACWWATTFLCTLESANRQVW